MMKNIIIALFIIFIIVSPCYAVNIVDKVMCKEVVLLANSKHVLVNRITGEVRYLLQNNGTWTFLKQPLKGQLQAMVDYQASIKR